ncbi:MAG: sigma factor [Nocardioidaceae bacterium]
MSTIVTGIEQEWSLDEHRRELVGYCYRMLGSAFDAEDAVQETMVRAWRARDRFEGRSTGVDPARVRCSTCHPRQRAVLILRDVLRWKADEVATLLETSTASVNSALQRARTTLETRGATSEEAYDPLDEAQRELLAQYVKAFESHDVDRFVALLHQDATQNMPPYEMWLEGPEAIGAWMLGVGIGCRGSRLLPTVANGATAFAQYRASGPDGRHEPWALQVLEVADGQVMAITSFLDTRLFALLGLPAHPDG